MLFPKRNSNQQAFHYPFYLAAVLMVLVGTLAVNGYFELQRTRRQLFDILESEAVLVIQSLEKNVGDLMGVLSPDGPVPTTSGLGEGTEDYWGIEDLLIERLITLALERDRGVPGGGGPGGSTGDRERGTKVKGVYFLDAQGKPMEGEAIPLPFRGPKPFFAEVIRGTSRLAVFRGEGPLRKEIPLALAVARGRVKGIILLVLSPSEYQKGIQQVIIQRFLEDFSGKGNIAYLRVEDAQGEVLAQAGQVPVPSMQVKGRDDGPPSRGMTSTSGEREKEGFLEVQRIFQPQGKSLGTVRVGLNLKSINPILSQNRRNIFLMGGVLFGLGLVSLLFIFRLQKRNWKKIQEMEEQMRQREELSAMGQLAAGVAHEIKNPLNAISLVVQRLEKEFPPPDPERREEYIRFTRIVAAEISRVNRIIGDFLLLARPKAEDLEEQALGDILHYCLEVLDAEFRKRRVRWLEEMDEGLPPLRCDRYQLTQAFLNIFNNALESMPAGGTIHLSVKKTGGGEPTGKKSPSPPAPSFVEIRITDSGQGISPEDLKKVFAPYFTTKEKGLGLGLAITRRLIRAHGGDVAIESALGKGTTVIVRLPVSAPTRSLQGKGEGGQPAEKNNNLDFSGKE